MKMSRKQKAEEFVNKICEKYNVNQNLMSQDELLEFISYKMPANDYDRLVKDLDLKND